MRQQTEGRDEVDVLALDGHVIDAVDAALLRNVHNGQGTEGAAETVAGPQVLKRNPFAGWLAVELVERGRPDGIPFAVRSRNGETPREYSRTWLTAVNTTRRAPDLTGGDDIDSPRRPRAGLPADPYPRR